MVQAGNNVGVKGAEAIAEALKVNTSLENIYLVSFLFNCFLMGIRCDKSSVRVTTVVQDNNNLGDDGATHIAEVLKANCTLKKLHLVSFVCFD
jgi:hypothetical protein